MPPQCAAVLAFRRDYGTDIEHVPPARPRSRDRGRLFVGPLTSLVQGTGGGNLAALFVEDLYLAAGRLFDDHNPVQHNQFNVVQWSRRNASVGIVEWDYVNEDLGVVRRRADVTQSRVHNWLPVS
jgi:hypothetical protein